MSEIRFTTDNSNNAKPVKPGGVGRIVGVVVVLLIVAIVLFNCFTVVGEGFVGVKYRFGKIENAGLSAGLNFHLPFIETIEQVDIRNHVYEVTTSAYTSDTQTVDDLRMKLTYSYDQAMVSTIIRETGVNNVESRLIVPNVQKISKNAIGKVRAEVLVQSRKEVQDEIQEELAAALRPYGIVVTQFALEDVNFDDAFEASIQSKVIAEQDALRMENKTREREEEAKQVVIAAQADADSVLISAEAEAKAIQLIQDQLSSSPNYIEYLKITNWNGILPQVIGDGVNPFVVLDGTNGTTSANTQTETTE